MGRTDFRGILRSPVAPEAVSGFDAVIHLAGESIVGRWSEAKKTKIRDSRVTGTRNLAQALAQAKKKPQRVRLQFGHRILRKPRRRMCCGKKAQPARVSCRTCAASGRPPHKPAIDAGIRTAQIRTGVVLSPKGGALGKMLTPFKMGVGGRHWRWAAVDELD